MAAILIVELLHASTDWTLATGHQNVIRLHELRLQQAIKKIGNVNLK
jgi:hypothetical protein